MEIISNEVIEIPEEILTWNLPVSCILCILQHSIITFITVMIKYRLFRNG